MPCKAMQPIVDTVREEGYDVQDISIDVETELAEQYDIMTVPTFVLLENDKEIRRHSGALKYYPLKTFLDS